MLSLRTSLLIIVGLMTLHAAADAGYHEYGATRGVKDLLSNTAQQQRRRRQRRLLDNNGRIAFGAAAKHGMFPYAAYLDIIGRNGDFQCSGALITPRAVLTAAHCVVSDSGKPWAKEINVAIGQTDPNNPDATWYSFTSYWAPPAFLPGKRNDMFGDIAIVGLDQSVNAKTIQLDDGTYLKPTDWMVVLGYGMTDTDSSSETLNYAAIPNVPMKDYAKWVKAHGSKYDLTSYVESDHFIAGFQKSDSCPGDSGGPVILPGPEVQRSAYNHSIEVGLVSYGGADGCGILNLGFYTRVSFWYNWIQDIISINNLDGPSPPDRQCHSEGKKVCFRGADIGKVAVATAGQCCEACRGNAQCFAWSYSSKTKSCSLKRQTGWTKISGSCTSGLIIQ